MRVPERFNLIRSSPIIFVEQRSCAITLCYSFNLRRSSRYLPNLDNGGKLVGVTGKEVPVSHVHVHGIDSAELSGRVHVPVQVEIDGLIVLG